MLTAGSLAGIMFQVTEITSATDEQSCNNFTFFWVCDEDCLQQFSCMHHQTPNSLLIENAVVS